MVIDFHTHIFPDNLADKAVRSLSESIDNLYKPVSDGTLSGLLRNMDEWGIDVSVVQPVITKPSQVKKTNEWARDIMSERIVSFGGIYPHTEDYKRDIDFVADLGLKGLKFHAEYQNFIIDDIHMLHVYDYALSKGLIILHHAGFDPAFNPPFKSSPRQFANIMRAMKGGTVVAAHLGGHAQWDDVEEHLPGTGIYLDTAMGFNYFPHDQFLRIVKAFGADKILFASDAPWSNAKKELEQLRALPLADNEKDAVLGRNAERLLNIKGVF